MSTVSENIRYLRKLKGYTQEQFAEQIGIKRSLLGAYEEARANPNEIYLDSMAELLGVPVEHLLKENLKERGRKLGPGTILRLNPGIPESGPAQDLPVKMQEKETLPTEKKVFMEDEAIKGAQMDLFASAVSQPVSVLPGQPDGIGGKIDKSLQVHTEVTAPGFIDFLDRFLTGQKDYHLFSSPADVPLKNLHLVGRRLERVESIETDRLYIISTHDGQVFFRRAFNQFEVKGTIILSSDFPEKQTFEVPKSAIKEVFEYVASIQTGAPSSVVPVAKLKELTAEMTRLLDNS